MRLHVLVAHESDTLREAIGRQLEEAGYRVTAVAEGAAALAHLQEHPAALILDVAIPGVFSYELLDWIHSRALPTRTILIASVYNRAGYKRRPISLYGAHDYLEQHHIPDLLLLKLARLLGQPPPDGEQVEAAVARDEASIREAGEARMRLRYHSVPQAHERARRLARLIVADIALYNPDLVSLDPLERAARLREDLEEGRLLFDLRVPREIREDRDFVAEALEEWIHGTRAGGGNEPVTAATTTPAPVASTAAATASALGLALGSALGNGLGNGLGNDGEA